MVGTVVAAAVVCLVSFLAYTCASYWRSKRYHLFQRDVVFSAADPIAAALAYRWLLSQEFA
jgi:hypothetical protein